MAFFKKKQVTVEAFQMTKEARWDNSEWPAWLHQAWQIDSDEAGSLYCKDACGDDLFIHTLEGEHTVTPGDYIIQGIQGEIYPCKPDIIDKFDKVFGMHKETGDAWVLASHINSIIDDHKKQVSELTDSLRVMTSLTKVKYGNLDKDIFSAIEKSESLISREYERLGATISVISLRLLRRTDK